MCPRIIFLFFVKFSAFGSEYDFHDSSSMDVHVGTFMICSFGTVLMLGDHKLSKIMSVVKGLLLTF